MPTERKRENYFLTSLLLHVDQYVEKSETATDLVLIQVIPQSLPPTLPHAHTHTHKYLNEKQMATDTKKYIPLQISLSNHQAFS